MSWDKVEKDIKSGPLGLFKWAVILVIGVAVIIGGLSAISRPADKAIDRIVMKTSFQYKEGMAQRGAILEANIAEIDSLLQSNPENREDLMRQKSVLRSQLRAITINE